MPTISRWVVPCYFTEENHKTDPILFDLTDHLKTMLINKVWNRKLNYGFNTGLKNTNPDQIKRATIKIFPRFISGYVNEKRVPELIHKHCGKLPTYLQVKSYKEWDHKIGFAIIETEYVDDTDTIPTQKEIQAGPIPHYEMAFIEKYHQHIAILKEVSSFFLATLHLSFPSESVMMRNDSPLNDGYFQILSGDRTFACKVATNAFMHEVLIETSKRSNIDTNMSGIISVWHHDLWSLHRYLKAVESDQISMDNLLDLIYALEGLFDKSVSSEFVKMMCLLQLCNCRKEARQMKQLLDVAYRIRNDIAHGGVSYDPFEYVKIGGEETLAQMVYWKVKGIVAGMLIKAISKMLANKEMKNLRFNIDDLISQCFKK